MSESLLQLVTIAETEVLSEEEANFLSDRLEAKIDACAELVSKLESEAERLRKVAREFQEAARATEAKLERFKGYVAFSMSTMNVPHLDGSRYVIHMKEKPGRLELSQEPTEGDRMAWPELVRVKLEWNKENIKRELEKLEIPFAKIVKDRAPVFKIRRGV